MGMGHAWMALVCKQHLKVEFASPLADFRVLPDSPRIFSALNPDSASQLQDRPFRSASSLFHIHFHLQQELLSIPLHTLSQRKASVWRSNALIVVGTGNQSGIPGVLAHLSCPTSRHLKGNAPVCMPI